jgi:hypothetical protein
MFAMLLVFSLAVGSSHSQTKPPERDRSDPPPSAPEYPGPGGSATNEVPEPSDSETLIQRHLSGFDKGSPFHEKADQFGDLIALEIRNREARGSRVKHIVVRGFADGTVNHGVTRYAISEFPPLCRRALTVPIDDDELAAARGCVIMQMLSARIGATTSSAVIWKSEPRNLEDGQDTSPFARRIEVEVQLWK